MTSQSQEKKPKPTSRLPDLWEAHEATYHEIMPAEVCKHRFVMRGLKAVECTQCHYGLTGLDLRKAEQLCLRTAQG